MTPHAKTTSLGILAAGLVLAGCGGTARTASPPTRAVPVRTATVAARDLDQAVTFTGSLRPRAQVQVVAEVGARLVRVQRDEGARVRKGDVLAVLDPTDYRLSHDRARAALKVAEANRAHAEAEEERAQNLLRTGGITDKERLAVQVQLQVAEAGLAQARAEAAIAAQQQARTTLRAPFDGRVGRRHADPGTMLAAGTPVFTVVDETVFELRGQVPAGSYHAIRVGAPVKVSLDSPPGASFPGTVARVTPLVDERNRSFEVTVAVAPSPGLVGGLFARASVDVGRVAGALVVPPAALLRDAGAAGRAVAYVVKDGKAERREVALGAERADAVQVTSGLAAGERVILDPPSALSPGAPVQVADAAPAATTAAR